ncbi:hypothetical protein MMUR_66010 [Mycolicibacterium murale]|uniref:Haloacid dehalogenase n=1 Tax=Mycolicibacterium murale TaxID=182220 RepID=A0A7I9WXM2_9MYCO|nr:hypothetical protein MMUR_66010 [Mycolicibacterium murale]
MKSIVGETLHGIVDPLVFAEAADLIADHKLCGRDVVVVSRLGREIVAPIARALGATHAMATRMVVEDGRYTGEVAFCYGEGKAQAIRELAHREGYPLEHCYAYSDSITDLPMLECVGTHRRQPGPQPAPRGRRRQWPVLTFSRPVSLRDRIPTIRRGRGHHRRGGNQCTGRRRADVLTATSIRALTHRDNDPKFTLAVTAVTEYKGRRKPGEAKTDSEEGSISIRQPSTDPGTHAEPEPL